MSRKRVNFGSREMGQVKVLGVKIPGKYFVIFLLSLGVSVTFYVTSASTYFDNFMLNVAFGFSPSWILLFFILVFVIGKPPGYFFDLIEMTVKGNEFNPVRVPWYERRRWRRRNPFKEGV